jgi:hypothetical protein
VVCAMSEFLYISLASSSRGRFLSQAVGVVFVGFVVESVAVEQDYLQVLRFFPVFIIPSVFHTHLRVRTL